MDLHRDPLEANEPVQVTVLGQAEVRFAARITNCSGGSLELRSGRPVARGTAVKVEWGETLLLGEVHHCQDHAGGFTVGVSLEHALYHTEELARLARRLLDDDMQRVDTSRRK
jgi:hypothetical protein